MRSSPMTNVTASPMVRRMTAPKITDIQNVTNITKNASNGGTKFDLGASKELPRLHFSLQTN